MPWGGDALVPRRVVVESGEGRVFAEAVRPRFARLGDALPEVDASGMGIGLKPSSGVRELPLDSGEATIVPALTDGANMPGRSRAAGRPRPKWPHRALSAP